MAIKVIKHGPKKFRIICPNCGCEFEYEIEDVEYGHVECPDCKKSVQHPNQNEYQIPYINTPLTPIPCVSSEAHSLGWPDCETCPNKPDPTKNGQVGDTPCDWCIKRRVTCYNGEIK